VNPTAALPKVYGVLVILKNEEVAFGNAYILQGSQASLNQGAADP